MTNMEVDKPTKGIKFQNYPAIRKSPSSYRILFIGKEQPVNVLSILENHDVVTVKNFNEAAYYLDQVYREQSQIPDMVTVAYEKSSLKKIGDFGNFLTRNERLLPIPFVLIENKASASTSVQHQKPMKGVDGIIPGDISAEKFLVKISLLKKFKAIKHYQGKGARIQKEEIPAARRILYSSDAFFKRLLDTLISALALVILLPIILIIALLIKIDSKGPVFYLSYRAGSNYRVFKFIKFRTMIVEADNNLSKLVGLNQYGGGSDKNSPVFFKISNDPRITKIGKFLRNTSLDELPQLFNVLKGDMSLVGNRPLPLYEAKVLTTDSHAERFNAPAGITGLWQISKRGQKEMSAEERIALDIKYARGNSFTNDLQIILKTPKALIQKDNV